MTNSEIEHYIDNRECNLTQDEIHHILDVERNPQIDHYIYEHGKYEVWSDDGKYFCFTQK